MGMDQYSIGELSIAVVSVLGAVGGCLLIVERSRCKVIRCCGLFIEREVPKEKPQEQEELQKV